MRETFDPKVESSCPDWSRMKSRLRQSGVAIELVKARRVADRRAERAEQREPCADEGEDEHGEARAEGGQQQTGGKRSERLREQRDVAGYAADAADQMVRGH